MIGENTVKKVGFFSVISMVLIIVSIRISFCAVQLWESIIVKKYVSGQFLIISRQGDPRWPVMIFAGVIVAVASISIIVMTVICIYALCKKIKILMSS